MPMERQFFPTLSDHLSDEQSILPGKFYGELFAGTDFGTARTADDSANWSGRNVLDVTSNLRNREFLNSPGDHEEAVDNRRFVVHVPNSYDGHSPLKVLFVLHGFDGSIDEMRSMTR